MSPLAYPDLEGTSVESLHLHTATFSSCSYDKDAFPVSVSAGVKDASNRQMMIGGLPGTGLRALHVIPIMLGGTRLGSRRDAPHPALPHLHSVVRCKLQLHPRSKLKMPSKIHPTIKNGSNSR
jgi:hypothetical protein